MTIDVSRLLTLLAQRASVHQEQLQLFLKTGQEQIGRALGRQGHGREDLGGENESVEWALKAQIHRARLDEVQALIAAITFEASAAASAGRDQA